MAFVGCGGRYPGSIFEPITNATDGTVDDDWTLYFVRDGSSVIGRLNFTRSATKLEINLPLSPLIIDLPPRGQHAYKLQLEGEGSTRLWVKGYKLVVLEL